MIVVTCNNRLIPLCVSALALSLFGCGLGTGGKITTAPATLGTSTTAAATPAFTGQVYGGQQPISGAEVMLWQVNTNTTGTSVAATPLLNAPVLTSGTGSFSLTGFISNFNSICYPSSGTSPQVYLTATLGNPGAGSNSSLALMTAIGTCSQLGPTSHIQVNEATTVAAVWALQQFFGVSEGTAPNASTGTPAENIVTAGTAESNIGMANAFLTANLLVSYSTGAANSSNANIGLEVDKLYAIANVLAACVNSNGTGDCPSLFSAVTPAGSIFPGDTIQAALYMAQNPAYNVPSVYALQSTTPPYPSQLTSAPFDWSLAITYSGSALQQPNLVASDATGNIWITNALSGSNSLAMLAPGGAISSYLTGSSVFSQPQSDVIDTNGNIWIASHSTSSGTGNRLVQYQPTGNTSVSYTALPSGCQPYNAAIDGSNDVFFACNGLATPALYELPAGSTASSSPTSIGSLNASTESYGLAVDSDTNVWVADTQTYQGLNEFTGATTGTASAINNFALSSGAYGVAIDNNNNAWAVNSGFLEEFAINSKTSSSPAYTTSNYTGAGLTSGGAIAVDGAGNLWASNRNVNTIGSGTYVSISEFNNAGTPLTPGNTSTQPGGLSAAAIVGGVSVTDAQPRGLAIDPSGNVWIAGCNLSTTCEAGTGTAGKYSFVMQFVGVAVPPVLPLSSAIAANKLGCCTFTPAMPTGITPAATPGYVGLQASTTSGNPAFTQNGGQFYFLVTRTGGFTGSLNIRYAYASPSSGTAAVYGTDYTDATASATGITPYTTATGYGTLTWASGDNTSRTIGPINWSDVVANGPTRAFVISLSCSVNCPTGYSPYQSETVSVTAAPAAPSSVTAFNNYFNGTNEKMYLGLPVDEYGGTGGLNGAQFAWQTIQPAALAAGFSDAYFHLNSSNQMVFTSPSNGATSSPGVGTNDARSELREYYEKTGYISNYDWDSAIGGTLTATVAVNATSVDTNEATIGQIHGENEPFALLEYQPACTFNSNNYTGCIVLAYNTTNTTSSTTNSVLLAYSVPLNTFFAYTLGFSGSTLTAGVSNITGSGTTNGTQTVSNIDSSWIGTSAADGMYFKLGAYSGAPNIGNPAGDQTQVTVSSFTITHP